MESERSEGGGLTSRVSSCVDIAWKRLARCGKATGIQQAVTVFVVVPGRVFVVVVRGSQNMAENAELQCLPQGSPFGWCQIPTRSRYGSSTRLWLRALRARRVMARWLSRSESRWTPPAASRLSSGSRVHSPVRALPCPVPPFQLCSLSVPAYAPSPACPLSCHFPCDARHGSSRMPPLDGHHPPALLLAALRGRRL